MLHLLEQARLYDYGKSVQFVQASPGSDVILNDLRGGDRSTLP